MDKITSYFRYYFPLLKAKNLEIKDNTNDTITGNFRYDYFPRLKAINGVLILLSSFCL